jgi:hypothetical protein
VTSPFKSTDFKFAFLVPFSSQRAITDIAIGEYHSFRCYMLSLCMLLNSLKNLIAISSIGYRFAHYSSNLRL